MDRINIFFHLASNTMRSDFLKNPIDVIRPNLFGTVNLLEYAMQNRAEYFLLASSMSIYGTQNSKEFITEDDYGYVDLQNPETSYDEAKRMAESLCVAYGRICDMNIGIARIGGTYGINMRSDSLMAVNVMLRQALESGLINIINPNVWRANTYVSDIVIGVFYILFFGKKCHAYNVSNTSEYMSMLNLGRIIAEVTEAKLAVNKTYVAPRLEKMALDSAKLKQLGYTPTTSTLKGIIKMYKYMTNSPDLSRIVDEDINSIIEDVGLKKSWHKLDGKTALITGATGMIPHYVVHTLMRLETIGIRVNVIASGRSQERLKAKFAAHLNKHNFRIIAHDISERFSVSCLKLLGGGGGGGGGGVFLVGRGP
ncbi:MAG: NAD-dependent epimerase/dehydratase family protein, partial [Helicobacteraceae bacterium]|nr:NAD-dependent epimerase/dehydratase family protein [Helicobacteraceae bacterium]